MTHALVFAVALIAADLMVTVWLLIDIFGGTLSDGERSAQASLERLDGAARAVSVRMHEIARGRR